MQTRYPKVLTLEGVANIDDQSTRVIFFKAFEESNEANHKWLLETADSVIQQWAGQTPTDPVRTRLGAMSGLLRAVADPVAASPVVGFKDLFATTSASDSYFDPLNFGTLEFDASSLDPIWFEMVRSCQE